MNRTNRIAETTKEKIDSLVSSFQKFIIEDYKPTKQQTQQIQLEWNHLKLALQTKTSNELKINGKHQSGQQFRNTQSKNQKILPQNGEFEKKIILQSAKELSSLIKRNNREMMIN